MMTPSDSRAGLVFALLVPILCSAGTADVVEDFDGGWVDGSYAGVSTYNHAGVGIWVSNEALISGERARSGDGVRFDAGAGSPYLEFQGLDGEGLDGGVGTVSFWYRHWDGDGSTVSFALEYSIDGGSWIAAGTGTVTTETAYQQFTRALDLPDDNIRLRILSTANNERLLIDDFAILGDAPGSPSAGDLTIVAANTTSGNHQEYQDPGDRIFGAMDPDVVVIQEFNVPDAGGRRAWVDRVFGTGFHFMVEPGEESIPCGVVSRYPITASGQWDDPQVDNRDFAWATIDIPGAVDLHVISVHLHGSGGSSSRNIEAGVIMTAVANQFPATDYIALCGDFNTTSRTEAAVQTFKAVFSDRHVPVDQLGNSDTNQNRNKPYDWVMPNGPLEELHQAVTVGARSFPDGHVFDTRLWSPPPLPAFTGDSGVSGMQHMAVIKSFLLPLVTARGTPVPWLESYGITSDFDNAELLDPDHDGFATWVEYVAGTDPTVSASVFEITTVKDENSLSLTCVTRPDRHYWIEFADEIAPGSGDLQWHPFASAAAGEFDETSATGGTHTFVDDFGPDTSGGSAPAGWRIYRIGVSLP